MQIGNYKLKNKLVLAPMAGVTDRPFRQLCKNLGAGMAVSGNLTFFEFRNGIFQFFVVGQ